MKQKEMKKISLFIIGLLVFGATNIQAQDAKHPWIVGIGTNFVSNPDNKEELFKTSEWNVIPFISKINAGKYLNKGFSFEVAATMNKITRNSGMDIPGFDYFALDGNFKYNLNNIIGQTGFFDPYLLVGGGYLLADQDGTGTFNYGAGFNLWLYKNVGLNFQTVGKLVFVDFPLQTNHWQHSVGLVLKFGAKDTDGDGIYDKDDACPDIMGLAALKGCPDRDGDGITDKDDSCPDIAGLAAFNGCPDTDGDGIIDKDDACPDIAGLAALNGCPDTDGDGIADKDDACPKVAGIAANKGCPWPDTDGDGVLDKDDKCPTEAGPASNNGCPEIVPVAAEKQITDFAKTILFDFNKSSIRRDSYTKLLDIIAILKENSAVKFSIEGHADNYGPAGYNQKLSTDRANSVRKFFINNGIDAGNLSATGYGETRPIDTNSTSPGRANNRRVEIKVVR
jgi:outer membrane protein OmpA-like peptidoglycan-associated protein